MIKSLITLIITFIIGIIFMAIGNDFLNGFKELGIIIAISISGALIVFFNEQTKT